VHGLSARFLADKPLFGHVVADLIEFLGDAPLVAHNAGFDFSFLNGELKRAGRVEICRTRMVDTLMLARSRHPGAKHTLDALCVRYGIDRSHRVVHGALLDAQLLSQVYVELTGGRQIGLGLAIDTPVTATTAVGTVRAEIRVARPHAASQEELIAHAAFLQGVKEPLWGASAFG
jgi:DNA polymerase-3 subunit epsilon